MVRDRSASRLVRLGLASAILLILGATRPCPAEILRFVRGGVVDFPARIDGETVVIETRTRLYHFSRKDFAAIEPGEQPSRAWAEMRSRALTGGARERQEAALWALEQGLTDEGVEMVRAAHALDPTYAPAARMAAALDRLGRPCPDPDVPSIVRALGVPASQERTPHILLLHQHDPAEASERAATLERVLKTIYLLMAADGLELPAPRHRLPSAWFANRSDYLAYLDREHAGAFRTTQGYYHPTRRLVAVSDARSEGWYRETASAIEARRQRGWTDPSGTNPTDRESGTIQPAPARELDRASLVLEQKRAAYDLGTAAHELVHQLVHETGLAPRSDAFPLWLHEGLAMQFEVVRGDRWAGVSRDNPLRLGADRGRAPLPPIEPAIRDAGMGHGYDRDAYTRAWSLTHYLRTERRADFITFLDLLRIPCSDREREDPERVVRAFRAAFGSDLAAVEQAWHIHLGRLRQSPYVVPATGR